MFQNSQIILSKSALKSNLRFIKKHLNPGVKLCSVVKGNAYGHGLVEYVSLAMECGVQYFAVHSAEDAYLLHSYLPQIPRIFIMGSIEEHAIEWAVQNGVEFAVFDFERLHLTILAAQKWECKAGIHIEVETGMRRTGFEHTEFPKLCSQLLEHKSCLRVVGLFTHFAGAESLANHFRVNNQLKNFQESVSIFKSLGIEPKLTHAACSAAMLNYPQSQFNMVRVGILQYGFWPNSETFIRFCGDQSTTPDKLKRVINWQTHVMSLKDVKKGCFVGYGTAYLAHKNMRLAIIPVGYSHGYSRNLSNVGQVLIRGKLCNVVGTVNMNSLSVDVTHVPDVQKLDPVILIGKQNGKAITVSSFSEQSNQLNYELLTRLPYSIPRVAGP